MAGIFVFHFLRLFVSVSVSVSLPLYVCPHCCPFGGFGPEWYVSGMLYSQDIPFWLGTLGLLFVFMRRKSISVSACFKNSCCRVLFVHCCRFDCSLLSLVKVIWLEGMGRKIRRYLYFLKCRRPGFKPCLIQTSNYPQRWNVTTSMVGLENGHIHKYPTQSGEPQRYRWDDRRRNQQLKIGKQNLQSFLTCCFASNNLFKFTISAAVDLLVERLRMLQRNKHNWILWMKPGYTFQTVCLWLGTGWENNGQKFDCTICQQTTVCLFLSL